MIRLILILLLPFTLYASKILSYNIYDRTDRVDVMITFDTPYEGTIKQSTTKTKIIIKLGDSTIESSKFKKLSSKFLKSLTITPMHNYTQVVATIPSSISLKASKTSDSYGLRLRFKKKMPTKKDIKNKTVPFQLNTKKDTDMSKSYLVVIFVLIIGIAILIYLRKKVIPKTTINQPNAWLFKENLNQTSMQNNKKDNNSNKSIQNNNVAIRFQKAIDLNTSVVMLDFGEQSFLILMGKSNILLDKYIDNKPSTQEDFETILQSRNEELNDFLNDETKKPLNAFTEKAGARIYEEA